MNTFTLKTAEPNGRKEQLHAKLLDLGEKEFSKFFLARPCPNRGGRSDEIFNHILISPDEEKNTIVIKFIGTELPQEIKDRIVSVFDDVFPQS